MSIILVFRQKVGISDEGWEKLCRRYKKRDTRTLINAISTVCEKPKAEVKAVLEKELSKYK